MRAWTVPEPEPRGSAPAATRSHDPRAALEARDVARKVLDALVAVHVDGVRQAPLGDDDRAIGGVEDLRHLGAEHQHRVAGAREAAQEAIDLGAAANVDATGLRRAAGAAAWLVIGNVSPGQLAPFDPVLLVRKQISIIPACRYQPWYLHRALEFLRGAIDRYPFETLLDDRFGLADIDQALEESSQRAVTRASISCV